MLNKILDELARHGLLLKSDAKLPSVTTLVAGEPVSGSWWAHPKGHQIFGVLEALADHEDATLVKLVSGKDTFVHRRLFAHLISIGASREAWQVDQLSGAARRLLEQVDKHGAVRTDTVRIAGVKETKAIGEAARELEKALLVHGESIHTSTGKHAKSLERWQKWAEQTSPPDKISVEDAKAEFERIVDSLNSQFHAKGRLPWPRRAR